MFSCLYAYANFIKFRLLRSPSYYLVPISSLYFHIIFKTKQARKFYGPEAFAFTVLKSNILVKVFFHSGVFHIGVQLTHFHTFVSNFEVGLLSLHEKGVS